MKACTLHLISRFGYSATLRGTMAPKLDVARFAPPMARVVETAFIVCRYLSKHTFISL